MDEVYEYLKKAEIYYIATIDGDQPRVRPFGPVVILEGKLYIETGKSKDVFKQITINPKVEVCAIEGGTKWMRLAATLVNDDNAEARQLLLDTYPVLQNMYAEGEMQTLFFKDATAVFYSFEAAPKVVHF